MSEEIAVSRASVLDPDAVALVEELDAYLNSLYPPESVYLLSVDAMSGPDVRFFLARRGSVAVGCMALRVDDSYAELKRMYVRPGERGHGVATALMQAVERAAGILGVLVLRLETGVRQPEALALARKFGFLERGPFGSYRPDPLCVFMEKQLR